MGRVKLEIKKIENVTRRRATYSKRRNGLIKKAYELSVLCDVDIGMVLFSPSGELSHFAKDDRIEDVIARFLNVPTHERTKRAFIPPGMGLHRNLEVEELWNALKRAILERETFEQRALLFQRDNAIGSVAKSMEFLDSIDVELEQTVATVRERHEQIFYDCEQILHDYDGHRRNIEIDGPSHSL